MDLAAWVSIKQPGAAEAKLGFNEATKRTTKGKGTAGYFTHLKLAGEDPRRVELLLEEGQVDG